MSFISNLPFRRYIVSFLLAFLITLLILSGASIIFSFLPPPDWLLRIFDYSYLLSGFIASFFCARGSSRRGFLTGIAASLLYISILIMLGKLIFGSDISAIPLTRIFILSALCGGVGGILGINIK